MTHYVMWYILIVILSRCQTKLENTGHLVVVLDLFPTVVVFFSAKAFMVHSQLVKDYHKHLFGFEARLMRLHKRVFLQDWTWKHPGGAGGFALRVEETNLILEEDVAESARALWAAGWDSAEMWPCCNVSFFWQPAQLTCRIDMFVGQVHI